MKTFGKWAKRGVWVTLAIVMTIGCNPLQTAAFIFRKDDKIPAKYPLRPKEGPKKERDEEINVLILAVASGVPQEFAGMDRELATVLAAWLPEAGKENKEKYTVVPPSQLDKFKLSNPNWRNLHAATIGKKLGADYVLEIEIGNVQIFQPGSRNMLYEGRAEVFVNMYEVESKTPDPIHKYPHQYVYRPNQTPDVSEVPLSRYKQGYIDRLAQELIWMHLEHRPADGVAAAAR